MINTNSIESSSQITEKTHFKKFNTWLVDTSKATFTAKKIAVCSSIIFSFGVAYLAIAFACAARDINTKKISRSFRALYKSTFSPMPPSEAKANASYFCNPIFIKKSNQAKVYFGAFPQEKHENWLKKQNCKMIISASTEKDRDIYGWAGKYVAQQDKKNPQIYPLEKQLDATDLRQTKERIDHHLDRGESIYIHFDESNEAASSLAVFIAAKQYSISVESAIQKLGNCTLSQTSKAKVEKALKPDDDPFFCDRFKLFDIEG